MKCRQRIDLKDSVRPAHAITGNISDSSGFSTHPGTKPIRDTLQRKPPIAGNLPRKSLSELEKTLLGTRRIAEKTGIFQRVLWSTNTVFGRTLTIRLFSATPAIILDQVLSPENHLFDLHSIDLSRLRPRHCLHSVDIVTIYNLRTSKTKLGPHHRRELTTKCGQKIVTLEFSTAIAARWCLHQPSNHHQVPHQSEIYRSR